MNRFRTAMLTFYPPLNKFNPSWSPKTREEDGSPVVFCAPYWHPLGKCTFSIFFKFSSKFVPTNVRKKNSNYVYELCEFISFIYKGKSSWYLKRNFFYNIEVNLYFFFFSSFPFLQLLISNPWFARITWANEISCSENCSDNGLLC